MIDGSAIVTSRSGNLVATNAAAKSAPSKAHDILIPKGIQWTTGKDGQIFLTFSNSAAIGIDSSTQIKCLEYTQKPFNKEKQAFEYEPSVSKLRLQLEEGQVAIASNRLSPLSELRVQVPNGELRLHKGTCLIRYDAMGLQITAYDGNLTYYYPDGKEREFLTAPNKMRISDQSAERQQIAESSSTLEALSEHEQQLCQAVQHASQRVIFEANAGTGQAPHPVLIVKPQYFQQPALRPYQYKD